MPNNIIDSIQLSGTVYTIQGTGGGGSPTVELTQAEYDALVSAGTVSANTYYIITDAYSPDISAITSSVTSASTDSEIPTAKAVWEAASGGGTTYTAGRGIDITNDTISVSLPISAGTGTNSIREGQNTTASGNYSHAEGYQTSATSYASHAEGGSSVANGNYSHSEGYGTSASGRYSHAEGLYTSALTEASHAEGYYTKTANKYEYASGQWNVSNSATTTFGDSGNTLFSVGNGTNGSARHNAFEIRQNGDIYLTLDGQDVKLQDNLGGGGATYTAGRGINIDSANTISLGVAISAGTGTNSIQEGQNTIASGSYSHAEGAATSATSYASHAEGSNTTASEYHSHAEGSWTTASGYYSNAEGYKTIASGVSSHAEGYYTEAKNNFEHASGQYNVSSSASTTFGDSGNTLFSVGNGTDANARHNAFEIRQNGDIYFNDGTNDIKLQDKFSTIETTIGDINTLLSQI